MDFVAACVIFLLFGLGVVFVFMAIVGGEIRSEGAAFGRPFDLENPGMQHPPERHRGRLAPGGLGCMVGAIVLGLVVL